MKTIAFAFLLGLSFSSLTQDFGPQNVITGTQTRPQSVYSADLDGDGDMDVISAYEFVDKIVWFENDGQGNFYSEKVVSATAEGAYSVYSADLDLDGDIDVLSASLHDDKIAWYQNDGQGNFSSELIVSTSADLAYSVHSADLDEDGDMDVLSASGADNKIAWYQNDGQGNFSSELIISTNALGANIVCSADLDEDGDMDVISASDLDDKIAWYQNDGQGNFSSELIIADFNDVETVHPTDIDGDGDMDVLAASWGSSLIKYYLNDGAGNFSFGTASIYAQAAKSVFSADLDQDGDMDVLSAAWSSEEIAWYQNDGAGNLSSKIVISTSANGASCVYAEDLDQDGDLDVLSTSALDHKITWYENDGSGNFSSDQPIKPITQEPRSVYSADIDGDGDMDILSASQDDNKIAWYENVGSGNFSSGQVIATTAYGAQSVHAADLDGDGDIDVLSASEDFYDIAWYENDGAGNFSSELIIDPSAIQAKSIYAEDLDGDGDIDVLSASDYDDEIAWYQNDGQGNFSSELIISTNANGAQSVHSADLDGDGDFDVLSASYWDDKIAWYENDGVGNFSTSQVISTDAHRAVSVHSSDLDGDGDMDVLSASSYDDKIAWYENDGVGNFSSQQIISTSAIYASSVYSEDIDGDGDMDVISAAYSASPDDIDIAWYENDGVGNFSSEKTIFAGVGRPRSIFATDLDQDGDIDVVSASSFDDKIAWYPNLNGEGCTDELACNFNENAWIDNGSCCYEICGCTDDLASNYSEFATCNDGSCIYILTGLVYDDQDENGIFDNNDFGLAYQTINIEPVGVVLMTNDEGYYTYSYEGSDFITLAAEFNPIFPYNTTEQPIVFEPFNALSTYFEFGISKEVPDFGICVDLYPSGNEFLCNDWSNHNICYRNMGNVAINGIVELEYDPLFQGHAQTTPIDSTDGNIVYMSFENLQPGQMFFCGVDLLTPTVDYIGEYVTSHARVTGFYEGDQVAFGEQTLEMEIACAYDPNDKQAFPLGYTDEHWLLQQTEQEFLIRFQNTGNAPAQNIRIQDTLDVNFDIESFKLMANSHSVMTTIDPETRLIDFYFEDIQLPDSVNNEPDSHGLVSYKVTPLPNLPLGTVLENTAYIYFDNNDPIITNTTWTTIHECGGESTYEGNESSDCYEPTIEFISTYPNIEEVAWYVNQDFVGSGPEFSLPLSEPDIFEITLIASNPLCEESSSFLYEVVESSILNPCLADFTCDGVRNVEDLLLFIGAFGCFGSCPKDLNNDAQINAADLMVFLSLFNQDCE